MRSSSCLWCSKFNLINHSQSQFLRGFTYFLLSLSSISAGYKQTSLYRPWALLQNWSLETCPRALVSFPFPQIMWWNSCNSTFWPFVGSENQQCSMLWFLFFSLGLSFETCEMGQFSNPNIQCKWRLSYPDSVPVNMNQQTSVIKPLQLIESLQSYWIEDLDAFWSLHLMMTSIWLLPHLLK